MDRLTVRRLLDSEPGRLGLQIGGVALIFAVDGAASFHHQPLLLAAVNDLGLHLVTALVVLATLRWRTFSAFWWSAAVWSVLIDTDHLPGVFGSSVLDEGGGRPFPHSLLFIGVFWLASRVRTGLLRRVLWGAAVGVGLELLRDIADGGTIPLFWPVSNRGVGLPYPLYAVTLVAFVVVGVFAAPPAEAHETGAPS